MAQEDSKQNDKIRVTYWHGRGKAEAIRLVITACGIEIEETWLSKASEIKKLRDDETLHYGQLPLVTINDKMHFTSSLATSRYIGRKYGLYPKFATIDQQFTIDHVVDSAFDCHNSIGQWPFTVKREAIAKGKEFNLQELADLWVTTVMYSTVYFDLYLYLQCKMAQKINVKTKQNKTKQKL